MDVHLCQHLYRLGFRDNPSDTISTSALLLDGRRTGYDALRPLDCQGKGYRVVELSALLSQLGLPAIVAAIVTGAFALLSKKADHTRPDLLSEGYSTFVGDLRVDLMKIRMESAELRAQVDSLKSEVVGLEYQVSWLLSRLPLDDLESFHKTFGFAKPLPVEEDDE